MDIKNVAKATSRVMASYLTYQAVKVVTNQLRETNPGEAVWLSGFSSTGKIQDGEAYLDELFQAKPEMAFRVMTVREHLAQEVSDFLPEMVRSNIQQSNMEHRRQYLERVTQLNIPDSSSDTESPADSD
ncbi:chaperonin family protein RbcX [Roseofilum sp. BLCC_M91]|uniref:RuBisCO chaperone RbcX n=1 Tax=Roseofilum halophilum BLCC-M91 TaxID=3022259 RepID=A0ABT7BN22_9CYAN|nr:chaperonin family protein RbcX [Roseofilum halophilum]MDJ1180565.1 chaperonin family protein RbcX [Roseofilum halophilum BLCC-M91]